jgi:hypothetical protein
MLVEFTHEELRIISRSLSRSVTQFLKMGISPDKVTDIIEVHDYVNRLLESDNG